MADKELKYDRNEVVAELTSFYELLVKMYLPSGSVKYPPVGGWPRITLERFACIKKTDTVVDLLRHIPYVQNHVSNQIYDKTSCVDYELYSTYDNPAFGWAEPPEELYTVPSHVVLFANAQGRDGFDFLLDTRRGTITLCNFQSSPEPTELSQVSVNRSSAQQERVLVTVTRLMMCS